MIFFFLLFSAEIDKVERASLENVPSNYIESVCMPDFDEFFQQGAGYPLPEHKVTPVMNGGSANGPSSSSSATSSSTNTSYIDGKLKIFICYKNMIKVESKRVFLCFFFVFLCFFLI